MFPKKREPQVPEILPLFLLKLLWYQLPARDNYNQQKNFYHRNPVEHAKTFNLFRSPST
jgi:hypothetical protein